jgi:hypothetical protein
MSSSKSPVYIGAGSPELAVSSALTIINNAEQIANHIVTVERFAQLTGSTVINEDTNVDTNLYSALEYAQGTTAGTGGSAKDYAQKIDGGVSGETGDHSAKAWAVGGDGVTDTALKGASKEWAVESSGTVDGTFFSSKEYAHGTQASTGGSAKDYAQKVDGGVSGATSDHSAKAWAIGGAGITNTALKGAAMEWAAKAENSTVDGTLYSALHYAAKAEDAQTAAELAESNADDAKDDAVDAKDLAEAAKTAVDNTFDNFDDRFLGTFTTPNEPTLDNDDNALSVGAVYYNSTASEVRFWNGSTWDAPAASAATSASTATTQAGTATTQAGLAASAKTAAETAQAAAETAETNAETAETNAETAETNAEAALATFQSLFHGASTTTPSSNVSDGDLWFDTNTGINVMKVYNSDTPAWEQLTPSSANQTKINSVVANETNVNKVAAIDTNVTKVANIDGNVTTVAGIGTNGADVTTVAGRDTEISRLGTNAMSVGATSHLALLGTTDMANTTDGYLKVLGNATVTADMAILGSTTITDDMALLANTTITDDMALLADQNIIDDMETVSNNIASVNNFADLYQINDFTTTPTTDGGNNAVAEGDLAYDSTANKLKFYNGSAWEITSSVGVTLAQVQTEANNASVAMSIALG